jgi:hypothetical protein
MYLSDNEVATITRDGFHTTNLEAVPVTKELEEVEWTLAQLELGGHQHFMSKEIFEQPEALRTAMRGNTNYTFKLFAKLILLFQAVARLERHGAQIAAPDHRAKLRGFIFDREVAVSGGRPPDVRQFALDPDGGKLALDETAGLKQIYRRQNVDPLSVLATYYQAERRH